MSLITSIFQELLGLFVDDGSLALQALALALIAVAVHFGGLNPLAGGGLLLLGCIVISG